MQWNGPVSLSLFGALFWGPVALSSAPFAPVSVACASEGDSNAADRGPQQDGREIAHKQAEGHEASEGEGHDNEPVIENWWSWDYGPGKSHKNPPFGFAIINFAVFAYILYRLGAPSFRSFLHQRHDAVRKALDEASEIQVRAQEQLDRYQEKIQRIDAEVSELLITVKQQAEAERARIIAAAERQAAQLQRDAEVQVRHEIERARHELQQATVKAALAAAEAILKGQVQETDHKRLLDRYVASVEALVPTPNKRFPS